MKETSRNMETQLRLLRPKAPSDRVFNNIASQLSSTRPARPWRNAWTCVAAVLAVAAGIAVAVSWWPRLGMVPGSPLALPPAHHQPQVIPDMPPATMMAYRHVVGQSPDEFNRLLDTHAASLLGPLPSDDLGSLYQELMPN